MCSFSAQMKTKPTGHNLGRGRADSRGPGSISEKLVVGLHQPKQQSVHMGKLNVLTVMVETMKIRYQSLLPNGQ